MNIKLKQMDGYLSWLVSSQRRSGGINISKAITYGMPRGRGQKGNKAPRKKSRRVGETITAFVPPDLAMQRLKPNASPSAQAMIGSQCTTPARLTQSLVLPSPSPSPQHLQPQCFLPLHLIANPQQSNQTSHLERTRATTALGRSHNSILSGKVSSSADSNPPQSQHVLFSDPNPANPHQLAQFLPQRATFPNPIPANPPQLQPQNVPFPNPNPGEFLIYLFQFCPAETSMCFGCGNPLKQQDNNIGAPPSDLVVVSKMLREWTYQGQARSKMGNVYFHCDSNCIKRKEKEFHAHRLSPVSAVLLPYLQQTHRRFLA